MNDHTRTCPKCNHVFVCSCINLERLATDCEQLCEDVDASVLICSEEAERAGR